LAAAPGGRRRRCGFGRSALAHGDGRLPEIDPERLDIRYVGSARDPRRRDDERDVAPILTGALRQNGASCQGKRAGARRRVEKRVIGRTPADAADAVGQFDPRLRRRIRADRHRGVSLRALPGKRTLALRLQRLDLFVQLAGLG